MYKKILVGVALHNKALARKAIEIADALRSEKATVTLLHVIEDIPSYVANQIPKSVLEKSYYDAQGLLEEIAKDADAETQTRVIHGHAGRDIVGYADKHGHDCIVVASHNPELSDYILGSTASNVVRHAKCAVHVLR